MVLQDFANSEIDLKIVVEPNSTLAEGMDFRELLGKFGEIMDSFNSDQDAQNLTQNLIDTTSEIMDKTGLGPYLADMLGAKDNPESVTEMVELGARFITYFGKFVLG